jgi:putative nucleotidyltransferase with HDIG domain
MLTSDTTFPLVTPEVSQEAPERSRRSTSRNLRVWNRLGDPQVLYVRAVIAAGLLVILASMWHVIVVAPVDIPWFILAALTVLSGAATLRMPPDIPVSFSISDSFTITAALLFGPAAGAVTVVIETLMISFRLARRDNPPRRVLFNIAAPALAMWASAHAFFLLAGVEPLVDRVGALTWLIGPLAVFAALFFILNTGLIAGAVALEQHTNLLTTWRRHFAGLWLMYFGGAAVAALLIVLAYSRGPSLVVFGLVAPFPLILYVSFKTAIGRVDDQLNHLRQVNRMYLSTIETLAQAIDAKDQVTHGHIRRVQQYAVRLAQALGIDDEAQIRAIEAASLLHDLGKLAIPEHILNKPGRLTPTEFETMKRHATIGADILSSVDFPYPVVPIVRHHHEHWDGRGYPAGLKGDAIPIGARILSVVDCFDALTSDRPYRPKVSNSDALRILRERGGAMYDPAVVARFIELHQELQLEPETTAAPDSLAAMTLMVQSEVLPYSHRSERLDPRLLTAFYDLGREIAAADEPSRAIGSVHRALTAVMPAACTAIFAYSSTEDRLVARWVAGEHAAAVRGLSMLRGQRLTGWVAANRSTIVNSDAALDLGNLTMKLTPTPHACLSSAIRGDDMVGVLTIYSTSPEPFTDAHATIVEAIASRLAPLVQRAVGRTAIDVSNPRTLVQEGAL